MENLKTNMIFPLQPRSVDMWFSIAMFDCQRRFLLIVVIICYNSSIISKRSQTIFCSPSYVPHPGTWSLRLTSTYIAHQAWPQASMLLIFWPILKLVKFAPGNAPNLQQIQLSPPKSRAKPVLARRPRKNEGSRPLSWGCESAKMLKLQEPGEMGGVELLNLQNFEMFFTW
jgi:hypothetical protein